MYTLPEQRSMKYTEHRGGGIRMQSPEVKEMPQNAGWEIVSVAVCIEGEGENKGERDTAWPRKDGKKHIRLLQRQWTPRTETWPGPTSGTVDERYAAPPQSASSDCPVGRL